MMKNEKAPNLRNYEKVARTAANVIGMRFDEKSNGYSGLQCVRVFGAVGARVRMKCYCNENPRTWRTAAVDRRKVLVSHVTI